MLALVAGDGGMDGVVLGNRKSFLPPDPTPMICVCSLIMAHLMVYLSTYGIFSHIMVYLVPHGTFGHLLVYFFLKEINS